MRFKWVTDCFALKFILTYEGDNPAVLRLQMRIMCWDVDLEHRTNEYLVDADYWSRLGKDLCFDPLLLEYVNQVIGLRKKYPAPERLPMQPQHMPHYRVQRIKGRKVQDDEPVDTSAMEIIQTTLVKFFQLNAD